MKPITSLLVAAVFSAAFAASTQAQVRITEVAAWSSSITAVGADWFEVTNFGSTAASLVGWKVDDNSFSFSAAVALNGISSLAPGESAIFIESNATNPAATVTANFITNWFGGSAPAGFQIGTYSGSGVGLGTGGDGVILFDAAGVEQTRVSWTSTTTVSPYATLENAAGQNNIALSTASVSGVNGAFTVTHGAIGEIGSPGQIAAVPEPEALAFLLAGLAFGAVARRRRAT